jgi:hypothetical protein
MVELMWRLLFVVAKEKPVAQGAATTVHAAAVWERSLRVDAIRVTVQRWAHPGEADIDAIDEGYAPWIYVQEREDRRF